MTVRFPAGMKMDKLKPRPSKVEVRDSPVHGKGVFALCKLPRNAVVARYDGHRYSAAQALEVSIEEGRTYLFALSDGSVIDGARGGNESRFLNHSCAPNCEALEIGADGDLFIQVHAKRAIAPGEELFLDYQLIREAGDPADYECACGATTCRGTMIGPDL